MGIETALVGMGMSAATASAVTTGVITAGIGAAASYALAPKQPKQETQVAPLTQSDKPPQQQQAPDRSALRDKNALVAGAAGALGGNTSTMLTGAQGPAGALNLGASTLLGQ